MPHRPKYPEATDRRNHYRSVADKLNSYRTTIINELNNARNLTANVFESSNLQGEYYEIYLIKKDDWLLQHNQIITSFDSFIVSLDVCIENARSQETLWRDRISIMEEY